MMSAKTVILKPPVRNLPAAKAKKTPARKATKKTAKKAAKKASTKSRKSVKAAKKPAARKPAPKATKKAAKKKKQIVGEGDYQASRTFLKDQSDFVKKNKSKIPELAKDAERALDGPEGDTLRQAEAEAASHARENLT